MKPVTLPANAPDTRSKRVASFMAEAMQLDPKKEYKLRAEEQTRSLKQNGYLWAVCYKTIVTFMREHHGRDYSDEAIHETLKELFLPSRVEQMKDREVRIYKSTKKLTAAEFSEYWEHIHRWAAEFGCVIPDPDPDYAKKRAPVAAMGSVA